MDLEVIKQLISKGETEKAMNHLSAYAKLTIIPSNIYALLLVARFNRLRKHKLRGTITDDNYEHKINKINNEILELITFLEKPNPDYSPNQADFKFR